MTYRKHPLWIVDGHSLANVAWNDSNAEDRYPQLFFRNGNVRNRNRFFAVEWPDHCVTTQHLGDATIHGPFRSAGAAERAFA